MGAWIPKDKKCPGNDIHQERHALLGSRHSDKNSDMNNPWGISTHEGFFFMRMGLNRSHYGVQEAQKETGTR